MLCVCVQAWRCLLVRRRGPSVQGELLAKSREAALNAVQTFNNPNATFKSETFIVLMVIAWTYLLHAYYRGQGIEYRYYEEGPKRRKFDRTKSGAFKYWELERCLNDNRCPLNSPSRSNLRFLIGLRHEIEHHGSAGSDDWFSGRYLACCFNYERMLTTLFGEKYGLGSSLSFALHFRDFTAVPNAEDSVAPLPSDIARYVQEYEASMPEEEFQSHYFSYRTLFVRKVTNKRGQADRIIEFVSPDSELAETIEREYQLLKEVERPKYLPSQIVDLMREEGHSSFSMYNHTKLWKQMDAKNPGKGYGVQVANAWYWYERWIDIVRAHC